MNYTLNKNKKVSLAELIKQEPYWYLEELQEHLIKYLDINGLNDTKKLIKSVIKEWKK
ncbi:conserved hypothetical protein [Ureaplasma parvum serovar 6 str. ATCC 27818]|uniref:hypothetical protein n=1 Tax=Ureaplasma parvum TaxID=134821 RepID=UPI000173BB67|nr:hypothetical protein [Ureaplasma parvum]EDU19172.1 conserved hypothetical protein [Ureaplasma parvum serovar 6 str. ATCC 27818]